jgi:hypothetical protein
LKEEPKDEHPMQRSLRARNKIICKGKTVDVVWHSSHVSNFCFHGIMQSSMRLVLHFRIAKSYRWIHRRFQSSMSTPVNKTAHPFDKVRLEALLNRRFFYAPAFEIYGGALSIYPI